MGAHPRGALLALGAVAVLLAGVGDWLLDAVARAAAELGVGPRVPLLVVARAG